jgi:ribosome-associated protein
MPEKLKQIIEALKDKKVENLVVLNLSGLVSYTDYFVIGTGNNTPHLQTLADTAASIIKIPHIGGVRMEGDRSSDWVLFDAGDYVLHFFLPEARKFYNLEELWEDAPKVEV